MHGRSEIHNCQQLKNLKLSTFCGLSVSMAATLKVEEAHKNSRLTWCHNPDGCQKSRLKDHYFFVER